MLSLLAGPFPVAPLDPLEGAVTFNAGICFYSDHLGLVCVADSGDHVNELYAVQRDGSAVRIGSRRTTNALGGDTEEGPWLFNSATTTLFRMLLPSTTELETYDLLGTVGSFGIVDGRLIEFTGATIVGGELGTTPALEYSFVSPVSSGAGVILFAGRVDGNYLFWCVDRGNGRVYLYDATNRTEVEGRRTTLGEGFRACGYSIKNAVFVVLRRESGTENIYVYSIEPVADALSDPTFDPTPAVGRRSTVSCVLTGDLDEPCPDRNITFTATVGEVIPATVVTDETGRAESFYYAPFVASTGEQIGATLAE